MRLPGLCIALAALTLLSWPSWALAASGEATTSGSVHVCGGGIEEIQIIVEAQPLPPVLEEDPSDNLDEGTVRICVHE